LRNDLCADPAPIPIVRIAAPQITGIQKLRGCGPSAAPGARIIQQAVAGSGALTSAPKRYALRFHHH
jgi:hypothetical protein